MLNQGKASTLETIAEVLCHGQARPWAALHFDPLVTFVYNSLSKGVEWPVSMWFQEGC